jgi:hypothetical protein
VPTTHPEHAPDAMAATEDETVVHRVGFQPDPFAWTPWQYADLGRFGGRWDDSNGQFRTVYVADSLLGCLLEVLSRFRPDPQLSAELDTIVVEAPDNEHFPTAPPGHVPTAWLEPRCAGIALLTGTFLDVRTPGTVRQIRHHLGARAAALGVTDLDAASLKLTSPRSFTQQVAAWVYQHPENPTGIRFGSRHGDEFTLWAVFEHARDNENASMNLTHHVVEPLTTLTPALLTAFELFDLSWV